MDKLSIILIICFFFSLLLNYINNTSKKNAIQIVNQMGQGYNLGSTFDSFSSFEEINTPNDQITLWGNVAPTKEIILSIKKYGFKTIRFPVTWMHFMDNDGKVSSEWMSRVKEVVDWIINAKMFCILDVHHDGASGQWLSEGIISKPKYIYGLKLQLNLRIMMINI